MLIKFIFATCSCHIPPTRRQNGGFALPMAMIMGMMMVMLGGASVLVAQGDRDTAIRRRESGASVLVSDSAISRALVQLSNPNNGVLLNRNYDPLDSQTGKNFLGPDGTPNSGDETTTTLDQWTGYNPSTHPCFQQLGWTAPNLSLSGTIGTEGSYTIRAYRYDKQKQWGTALVEGNYKGQVSRVLITLIIEPVLDDFPGIITIEPSGDPDWKAGVLALRGRQIMGSKGNVYFYPPSSADPSLTGISRTGNATRPNYLNAIYASVPQDGAVGDQVLGKIFACKLRPWIPPVSTGTNLGVITTSQTLSGVGGTVPTLYQIEKIDLDGDEVLTIDTTGGPVHIEIPFTDNYLTGIEFVGIELRNNAKILNIRTDGKPPRVGDLRIMARGDSRVVLHDRTCIQDAFLWFWWDELRLLTTGPGCPSGRNTNVEGVLWMEAILSSKNAASNRNVNYLGVSGEDYDTTITPSTTSGIAVPDDVTSLVDLLEYVDWPVKYKYGAIQKWQRVN